jgi:hypothetical protein
LTSRSFRASSLIFSTRSVVYDHHSIYDSVAQRPEAIGVDVDKQIGRFEEVQLS